MISVYQELDLERRQKANLTVHEEKVAVRGFKGHNGRFRKRTQTKLNFILFHQLFIILVRAQALDLK